MAKSSDAKVIDLGAFREKRAARREAATPAMSAGLMVPVWFCWVPMWAPFVG